MHAIIALRENGKGYTGLESVFGYMNLVPPMNINAFNFQEKKRNAIGYSPTYQAKPIFLYLEILEI